MQPGEGHHVDGQLAEISIELTRETKASGDTRHGQRDEMVQVAIGRSGQFQGTETNVIERLVVNAECLISVFYKLVNRQGSIVRFHDCVTDLKRHKWTQDMEIFRGEIDL